MKSGEIQSDETSNRATDTKRLPSVKCNFQTAFKLKRSLENRARTYPAEKLLLIAASCKSLKKNVASNGN